MSYISISTSYNAPSYVDVVTSDTQMISQAIYMTNGNDRITLTLPSSPTVGDIIEVISIGENGWKIAQPDDQAIQIVDMYTTVGTGGSISSIDTYNCIRLVCVVGGTTARWSVVSIMGTLTIV